MKIAICHDFFEHRAGGEKLALFLAQHYNASIFSFHVDLENTFKEKLEKLEFHTPKIQIPQINILKQEIASSWFSKLDLKNEFDIVISTGTWSSVYSCILNHPNIWQCLSPPRIFYDLYNFTKLHNNPLKRSIINIWRKHDIPKDQNVVKNYVDKIVSISKTIDARVKKYYNRDSEVIYPPVETKDYKCKDYQDFFLVIQRLYPPKRTSIIVEAFKKMPDKKLIIVGDGPERKELEHKSSKSKNIQFLPFNIPQDQIIDLYSRCIATIYIPKEEDFGFIPIESMASGKPCIGSNEGGVKETIIDRKTGFLITPTVSRLISTVKAVDAEKAESMKNACMQRAKVFDTKNFYKKWDTMIKESLP